ncbi:MAG: hypothetical protein ACT4OD_00730 [Candidatus Nitrosotenuis sp.]
MKSAFVDPIDFKLKIVKKILAKIPDKTPKENSAQQMKLEVNAAMFLFFASSVVEMIKRHINDTFEIFDSENVFYIHGLRKNLGNSDAQKKVKQIIANYFTTPQHTKSRIDTCKSSLWKLQVLRNQAMHGNIIKIGNGQLFFSYTIHDGKNHYKFVQRTHRPQKYFGWIFDELNHFTRQTLVACQNQTQTS